VRRALLIGTAFWAVSALAQEPLRPATRQEWWLSAAVQGRLPGFLAGPLGDSYKRFRLRGELGYRSTDVFYEGRQSFLDINLRYKAAKWLALAYEHRFAMRGDGSGIRNRSIVQAEAQRDWGRFTLAYRTIYQHSYIDWGGKRDVLRNRLQAQWNIKGWKLDPQFSAEAFTWAGYQGLLWFGTRYQLTTTYDLNKANSLTFGIIHDRERGMAWPTHRWIGTVTYSLNLREL
jgi:hypothetical protein